MDDTDVFLVRVWRRDDRPCAAVQRVGSDAARVFADALGLGRFLLAPPAPPATPAPPCAPHPED